MSGYIVAMTQPPPPPSAPGPWPNQATPGQFYPPAAYGQPYPPAGPNTPSFTPSVALAPKNPWLGRVSLILVAITSLITIVAMIPIGSVMADLMAAAGTSSIENDVLEAALQTSAPQALSAFFLAFIVGVLAGIMGLIAGIIGRGRLTGLLAFALGFITPLLWTLPLMYTIGPILNSIR